MKARAIAVLILSAGIFLVSCNGITQAEDSAIPPVEVNKTYKIVIGMGFEEFKVLEIGKAGLIKVQLVTDPNWSQLGGRSGQTNTIWWLNLKRVLLVEAKE